MLGRASPAVGFLPNWASWFLGRRAGDFGIIPSVPLHRFGKPLALMVLGTVNGARRIPGTQAGLPLLRRNGGEGHRVL